MPTITVKNIPPDLYERLKNAAQIHRRSLNNQIITYLENALRSERVNPQAFLARLNALHEEMSLPTLTDQLLENGKEFGRK